MRKVIKKNPLMKEANNGGILKLLFTLLICSTLFGQTMQIQIVPTPQRIEIQEGSFELKSPLKLITNSAELEFTASLIRETLSEYNKINSSVVEGKSTKGDIILTLSTDNASDVPEDAKSEAYTLVINKDNISVTASTPKGIFYGTMSLIQMLEKAWDNKLQSVNITDWADVKVRGISDDISRGQVSTMDNFKKIIRFIARYKMNTYMPYLEDMLRFDAYPSIGEGRGALTKNEVKELVEYASKYYVEVVPIFQTLGHYENILVREEYLKYAEFPGAASLNVSFDETYSFLETMMKEVFEMFPSEYFHMGADESWDVGLGLSRHLVEKSNLAMVHLDHYKKVYSIAKKYGKKVIMYGDIILNHPEILEGLPKDITIVDWHYRPQVNYPSTKIFKDAGHEYYVSPSVWNFPTPFPTNVNAVPNIKYIIKSGLENGTSGMINSNWGDYGGETFRELNFFGYAWSAQCAWNYSSSDENTFSEAFFNDFFGSNNDAALRIYNNLNNPLNQMTWHDIFRHPLLPFRDAGWWEPNISAAGKLSWMQGSMPMIKKDLEELRLTAKKNTDHLNLLGFIAELNEFYISKLNSQILLHKELNERGIDPQKIEYMVDDNLRRIAALKANFKKQWLTYYKPDNLDMIEDKFDRLTNYFEEIKTQLNNGGLASPIIKSEWIYNRVNDSTFAKKAEFKKDFNLKEKPVNAFLQLLGDTYVKLFINGQFVDQVYARRSLSLLVDYHRIKFIDIAKYLKEGNNTITVEAANYNNKGAAGFNLIANIESGNEVIEVLSDKSWLSKAVENDGNTWISAEVRKYPFIVTAPNFATKRTSWIER